MDEQKQEYPAGGPTPSETEVTPETGADAAEFTPETAETGTEPIEAPAETDAETSEAVEDTDTAEAEADDGSHLRTTYGDRASEGLTHGEMPKASDNPTTDRN